MIRNIILLLYGGTLLLMALRSLRHHRLKERYVLLFLATSLPFVGLAVWPDALDRVARALQMPYQTLMIVLLAGYMILVIFQLMSIVSVQERRIATLAQMVGLLSERVAAQDRKQDTSTNEQPPH